MSAGEGLEASLPVPERLALSYAPARSRAPWLALLALDVRLAGIVRSAREPMLAQVRLAWWRDLLEGPATAWPLGEPVLAALAAWQGGHGVLSPLAEAWGGMTGDAPLEPAAFIALADARANAFGGLAELLGAGRFAQEARRMSRSAALADLSGRVSHAEERAALAALVADQDWRGSPLPRTLRPLTVIHGLAARRNTKPGVIGPRGLADLLTAMRLGLLGR